MIEEALIILAAAVGVIVLLAFQDFLVAVVSFAFGLGMGIVIGGDGTRGLMVGAPCGLLAMLLGFRYNSWRARRRVAAQAAARAAELQAKAPNLTP